MTRGYAITAPAPQPAEDGSMTESRGFRHITPAQVERMKRVAERIIELRRNGVARDPDFDAEIDRLCGDVSVSPTAARFFLCPMMVRRLRRDRAEHPHGNED